MTCMHVHVPPEYNAIVNDAFAYYLPLTLSSSNSKKTVLYYEYVISCISLQAPLIQNGIRNLESKNGTQGQELKNLNGGNACDDDDRCIATIKTTQKLVAAQLTS